jgi:chitinase
MHKFKLLFLFAILCTCMQSFAQVSCYNIVGYYPSWVAGGNYYINAPSQIDYSKYTHIMYAFAIPDGNGNIGSVDNSSQLKDLVTRGHAANVKVLLSIGGWLDSSPNGTPFETIANSTTSINNFATTVGNLITQYNLDGIDLDWEYPTTKAKWNAIATALGTKIHGMGKLFTAAVSEDANNSGNNYDNVTMLDLVNIMCYGPYSEAVSSMNYWTSRGVPQNKRMLGVPFYSSDNTTAEHVQKSNLAKTGAAGGIMIWDIATEYGDINSIYSTLGTVCKGGTPVPTNLASGKPVTVSSSEPNPPVNIDASNITDGNYSTRWSSAYADPQWAYVDLGASYDINRVKITWEAAYATNYLVQVSADANNWTTIKTVTANATTTNDMTGLTGTGRYVRIYGTARATTYGYSIYELEVYGAASVAQTPYNGTAATIPGKIEAENYDNGGEGVAYHDLSTGNLGGAYRTSESVDLETCGEGGYDLSHVQAGEWEEYTVNVTQAGTYTLQARVASEDAGSGFHVELDGVNISGTITVPNTGDWQTWQTVSVNTPSLTAGTHVLRIVIETAEFNVNYLNFVSAAASNTNLALNKTGSASSVEVATGFNFAAQNAFDGNSTTTRWSSAYNDGEWLAVDLGSAQNISSVVLKWENAYASSYLIQTSTDNTNWTTQKTVTTGAGGTETQTFATVSARYVRMQGVKRATVYGYSIWEFEVYGGALNAARQDVAATNTSINESLSVNVWPNPASGILNVQYKGVAPQSVLRAFSINGQQVYGTKLNGTANQLQVDISSWPKGVYIISIGDLKKKIVVE